MVLFSKIQEYFTIEDLQSLDLYVLKKEWVKDLWKEELLNLLATQDLNYILADIQSIKKLLADKWIKQCTSEERETLYDDFQVSDFYRWEIEISLGFNIKAEKYLQQALISDDVVWATRAAIRLWHTSYAIQELNQAEVYYKKAIEKNDPTRSAHACIFLWNLYCVYNTTQCYGRAEQLYQKAMAFNNPEITARANLLLWHLYIAIKKADRAKIVYERAAKSDIEEISTAAKDNLKRLTVSWPGGILWANWPVWDDWYAGENGLIWLQESQWEQWPEYSSVTA